MRHEILKFWARYGTAIRASAFVIVAASCLALPAGAQDQGPLPGHAPADDDSVPLAPVPSRPARQVADAPATRPAAATSRQNSGAAPSNTSSTAPSGATGSGTPNKDAPPIPVDQIIQKFAAREDEFRQERDNFTYTQDFVIQTIGSGGKPDGEYEMTSDITFTPDGKRYELITYAPPSTLERIMLSQQDLDDLRNVQPFVLTTEQLPKYNVTYAGREKIDELGTYVFDVGPKVMEKNQRYFQGRIWVDDKDLEIVKTYGKAVPDIRKGKSENVFPRFETYRENIEGNYWFPTYTHADDVLHFTGSDVRIRMVVHYSDYKRFRVSIKLLNTEPATTPSQPPNPPALGSKP